MTHERLRLHHSRRPRPQMGNLAATNRFADSAGSHQEHVAIRKAADSHEREAATCEEAGAEAEEVISVRLTRSRRSPVSKSVGPDLNRLEGEL